MPFPLGLSLVRGKAVVARFDGGRLSSEGGLLLLREVERRLVLADRLAAFLKDPRAPDKGRAPLGRRSSGSACDDCRRVRGRQRRQYTAPRCDVHKLALDRLPSDEELCSQCKRSVKGACRCTPIGAIIGGWRCKQNKCPPTVWWTLSSRSVGSIPKR